MTKKDTGEKASITLNDEDTANVFQSLGFEDALDRQ